jgi:hypothetical protein
VIGDVVTGEAVTGVDELEGTWQGPGPRFVRITARFHNLCAGCSAPAPVGSRVTYDRLERAAYHGGCSHVAVEPAPWVLVLAAGDEPRPGQVIAHPAYGWLVCVRLVARRVVVNDLVTGRAVAVAARRALPEEVEAAQCRARFGEDADGASSFWLDFGYVGTLVDATAEFTGWPVTRLAREPERFVRCETGGVWVFGQVAPFEESERWIATDAGERHAYLSGYRWCRCFSVQCLAGEYGHVHLSTVIPITESQFASAGQRGWRPDLGAPCASY